MLFLKDYIKHCELETYECHDHQSGEVYELPSSYPTSSTSSNVSFMLSFKRLKLFQPDKISAKFDWAIEELKIDVDILNQKYIHVSVNQLELSKEKDPKKQQQLYDNAKSETSRNFSVDAIERVEILEKNADNVSETKLNSVLGSGYGIFSGKDVHWATLHFTTERARWVAYERWHPNQKGKFMADGSYELKVPYNDDRELIMGIMKHGSMVQVMGPETLRAKLVAEITRMQLHYIE